METTATGTNAKNDGRLRIGAVAYLNTAPLIDALPQLVPSAELVLDHPSRLADDLAAGRLDVALVPCIELARHPEWSVVSTACIAACGPVLSVRLLFRRPPAEVRTLALDEGSRTSAVLAQILLADIHGVHPELQLLPVDAAPSDASADAVLVIGDRAIRSPVEQFIEVWDLAERWRRWTELPFVFAVWAARPGVELLDLESSLEAARDAGLRSVDRIAAERAVAMDLPHDLVLTYLRDHLHFDLGARERRGLSLYFRRAAALGLIPHTTQLSFDDRPVKH
jgi:chorismate dehydratase